MNDYQGNPFHSLTYMRFIFDVFFNYFLKFIWISIIIFNFLILKNKFQVLTEAMARIIADTYKEASKKWLNFYDY